MKKLSGIAIAFGIALTLLSHCLQAQVQLIPTKSDFGGGYNLSCNNGTNGSISLAVVGADSLTLILYKGSSKEDSAFVNSFPKVWNGLAAGTYKVYGYFNDSLVAGDTVVLFQPQALALANYQTINQSCNPGGDGSLEVEITGGVLPYHFSWTGRSDTLAEIDSLGSGIYGFTVTDGNGCQFSSNVNVGTANAPQMTLHVSTLNQWGYHVNCAQDETANVWVDFVDEAWGVTVNWDITKRLVSINKGDFSTDTVTTTDHVFVSSLDSLNGVSPGTYRITATNQFGCSVTDSIEVLGPIAFGSQHKAACNEDWYPGCDFWGVKFWENVYGGISPYHAYGTGSGFQDTLYVAAGTTYYLDVHDAAGCRKGGVEGPFQMPESILANLLHTMCNIDFGSHVPVQLVLTKDDFQGGANVSCYGFQDGSITTAVIGADTLTLVLSKNGSVLDSSLVQSFPKTWSGLGAGNYLVRAYRGIIPITGDSIKLYNPQLIHLKSSTIAKETCSPGGDGSIFIDISGGVQPYHYVWEGRSDTTATIDSLEAGNYTYTVTDVNGCTTSSTLTVGNTGLPLLTLHTTPLNQWGYHLSCWNDESAKVWATVTSTENLEVNWHVKEIEGRVSDNIFGLMDSTVSENSYYVSGIDTLQDVTSGWYIASIGNGAGCTVKDSVEIKAPYKLGGQLDIRCNQSYTQGCNCYGIELTVKPVGGIPPYSIMGHENVTQDSLLIFADNNHYLFMHDAAGCYTDGEGGDTMTINLNDAMIHGICGNDMSGILDLVAANKTSYPGGYNVSKHGGNDGEVDFIATAGCMDDHQYYYKKLPNGNLVSVNGGDGNHASGLGAGNYMAYVYSCDSTKSDSLAFTMTQPESLQAQIAVMYQTNCNGNVSATLFAQVSGGVGSYTYQWTQSTNGGQPTNVGEGYNLLNISSFGTYYLKASDSNGDTSVAQINIQPAAQLSISANRVAKYGEYHTRCDVGDGEVQVQLSGGIAPYALHINGNIDMDGYTNGFSKDTTVNDTSFTLHGFSAGNVGISVQDAGGCNTNLSQNINLKKPDMPDVFITGTTKPNGYYVSCDTCTDAELTVVHGEVLEPLTYGWYEIPEELNHVSKIEGASIFQKDDFNSVTGEGMTPFATTSSISHITPGSLNILVTKDALGCRANNQVMIEKPKPFTQGWALDGNTGLDTTAYIGTRDSVDLVLKSNGANNPQPQLKLKASGGVEVNGPAKFSGMVKVPNMAEVTDTTDTYNLVLKSGNTGTLMTSAVTLPSTKGLCFAPSILSWGNPVLRNQGQPDIVYNNTIRPNSQDLRVGIGIGCVEASEMLHVEGNEYLSGFLNVNTAKLYGSNGNFGIGTGNPEATLDIRTLGDYAKGLQLGNSSNRLFFVPKNGGYGFNNLSQEGDAGLFWSDGLGSGGKNQSAGFTIGPFKESPLGIRIDGNGNVGIGENNPLCKLQLTELSTHITQIIKTGYQKKASIWTISSTGSFGFGVNKAGYGQLYMGKIIYDSNRDNNQDESAVFTVRDARYINWGDKVNTDFNALINMDVKGNEIGVNINLPNPGSSGNKPKGLKIDCDDYNSVNAIEVTRYVGATSRKQFVVTNYGEIYCKLLWVKADQTQWPDYVFEENYELPTLSEIDKKLMTQKHLDGVQSATEVSKDGLNVSENLQGLTKNIEELYLHLILLEKRIKELEQENTTLKNKK